MVMTFVRGALAALVFVSSGKACQAQSLSPRLTMQGPAEASAASVPRDGLGRPCLDIEAAAREQTVNPNMFDHVVSIKNICPRLIKVKVCYFNSTRCSDEDVRAYKRLDVVLGSMRGVKFFKYTITQK